MCRTAKYVNCLFLFGIIDFLSASFEFMDNALQDGVSSSVASSEAKSSDDGAEDSMAGKNIVLVHCEQGISRSTTVVLYYLMRKHGWSLERSFAIVSCERITCRLAKCVICLFLFQI